MHSLNRLLGIHDTPSRIALGFGMGLFLGVFPGTGALAAIVCAFVLRLNKAAALAGALAINTWINVAAFPLALGIGAFLFGIEPARLRSEWFALTAGFSWKDFLHAVFMEAALPVIAGYTVIGIVIGTAGYVVSYAVIRVLRRKAKSRD